MQLRNELLAGRVTSGYAQISYCSHHPHTLFTKTAVAILGTSSRLEYPPKKSDHFRNARSTRARTRGPRSRTWDSSRWRERSAARSDGATHRVSGAWNARWGDLSVDSGSASSRNVRPRGAMGGRWTLRRADIS
jgi:hypothetical protein